MTKENEENIKTEDIETEDDRRYMRLLKISGDIQDIIDNAKNEVEYLIDDYNEYESDNYEEPCSISKTDLDNYFSELEGKIEITLENSEY
tara:strand:- start:16 stop:285 length:270 start_codon:yes stop_codon:yes gene_type:complete